MAARKLQPVGAPMARRSVSWPSLGGGSEDGMSGAFGEIDLRQALQQSLRHCWTLWEKALAGEPLMVVAPTPAEASRAVGAVVSLVSPLPYCADFRPYLCIHDPAFNLLVQEERRRQREASRSGGCGGGFGGGGGAAAAVVAPGPGGGGDAVAGCSTFGAGGGDGGGGTSGSSSCPVLFGVTNTHFITTLPSFPNVLSVGEKEGAPRAPTGTSLLYPPNALRALRRRQQGASALASTHSQDMWAPSRPLTRPDAALLAAAAAGAAPGAARQLRRHFAALTAGFLAPFSRYFEIGPDGTVPRWDPAVFISSLQLALATASSGQQQQPPAPSNAAAAAAAGALVDPLVQARVPGGLPAIRALYARFISSTNFSEWFASRRKGLEHLVAPEGPPLATAAAAAASAAVRDAGMVREIGGIEAFIELEQQYLAAVATAAALQQQLPAGAAGAASTSADGRGRELERGDDGGGAAGAGTAGGAADGAQLRALERRLLAAFWSLESEDVQQTLVSSSSRRLLLQRLAGAERDWEAQVAALARLVSSLGEDGGPAG